MVEISTNDTSTFIAATTDETLGEIQAQYILILGQYALSTCFTKLFMGRLGRATCTVHSISALISQ